MRVELNGGKLNQKNVYNMNINEHIKEIEKVHQMYERSYVHLEDKITKLLEEKAPHLVEEVRDIFITDTMGYG
jgi:hypothetical protein